MTTQEPPGRHPRIVVGVQSKPGRYKAKADPRAVAGADGARVRVDVGQGLRPQDMATTATFAHSIRNAAVVEIIGRSHRAVNHAREVFLSVWSVDLPEGTQGGPDGSVARWAAVMLAQPRQKGQGPV